MNPVSTERTPACEQVCIYYVHVKTQRSKNVRRCPQIFSCSVWAGLPTPGSALMNLRYRNERAIDGGNSVKDSGRLPQQQAPPAALVSDFPLCW